MNIHCDIRIDGTIKKISDFQGIKRNISYMAENVIKDISVKLLSGFAVSSYFINFLSGIVHRFDTKISIIYARYGALYYALRAGFWKYFPYS